MLQTSFSSPTNWHISYVEQPLMKLLLNKSGLSPPGDPWGEKILWSSISPRAPGSRQSPESVQTELQFLNFLSIIKVLSACAVSEMNYQWEWPEHVLVIKEILFLSVSQLPSATCGAPAGDAKKFTYLIFSNWTYKHCEFKFPFWLRQHRDFEPSRWNCISEA